MDLQFAGTDGNGVFRKPLSELVGVKPISNIIPKEFKLYQNYPNPFNPITKIKYQISKANMNVEIGIFDLLGKKITQLVNQNQNAGTYEVDFDCSNYSSGIYFYTIETGEFKASRMMVLIK